MNADYKNQFSPNHMHVLNASQPWMDGRMQHSPRNGEKNYSEMGSEDQHTLGSVREDLENTA
jgi:hypothetical protein